MKNTNHSTFIASITPDMVLKVYSGKPGCMCGCRGKYFVNPTHKVEADKDCGYETDCVDGTNMINKVLKIMKGHPKAIVQGNIVYLPDTEKRNYVLYLLSSNKFAQRWGKGRRPLNLNSV